MRHIEEKPFQCKECGKTFIRNQNLTVHLRKHTGEKPFQCNNCNKTFSQKRHLTDHIRIHTGEKPFQCKHCGRTFTWNQNLSEHLKRHTGEKPFRCKECGKTFISNGYLTKHLKTHTGEKPFQCNHCDKSFSGKTHLKYHLRIHTGEKPHQCGQCGKSFLSKSKLIRHQKIHKNDIAYQSNITNFNILHTATYTAPSTVIPEELKYTPRISQKGPVLIQGEPVPHTPTNKFGRTAQKPTRYRDALEYLDENQPHTIIMEKKKTEPTNEEKYHRIRIINNAASHKCRQKQKQRNKDMEQEINKLEQDQISLKARVAELTKIRDRMRALYFELMKRK